MGPLEELKALEQTLLSCATRHNEESLRALLTDDFVEVGSSGVTYTKDDIIRALGEESPVIISADNFALRSISLDAALLTYTATKSKLGSPPVKSLRSSVWVYREGFWQMLFHQGTPTS